MRKTTSEIHYVDKLQMKNIWSQDTGKSFDEIQYPFTICFLKNGQTKEHP